MSGGCHRINRWPWPGDMRPRKSDVGRRSWRRSRLLLPTRAHRGGVDSRTTTSANGCPRLGPDPGHHVKSEGPEGLVAGPDGPLRHGALPGIRHDIRPSVDSDQTRDHVANVHPRGTSLAGHLLSGRSKVPLCHSEFRESSLRAMPRPVSDPGDVGAPGESRICPATPKVLFFSMREQGSYSQVCALCDR